MQSGVAFSIMKRRTFLQVLGLGSVVAVAPRIGLPARIKPLAAHTDGVVTGSNFAKAIWPGVKKFVDEAYSGEYVWADPENVEDYKAKGFETVEYDVRDKLVDMGVITKEEYMKGYYE